MVWKQISRVIRVAGLMLRLSTETTAQIPGDEIDRTQNEAFLRMLAGSVRSLLSRGEERDDDQPPAGVETRDKETGS
ncbi:hypothetical protein [Achromobacter sp. PAB15]|uniref:hypothetical protein n=1 Tax=Achromobacter sp. PAB15 TaxID=3233048 RepID=UPI003F92630D